MSVRVFLRKGTSILLRGEGDSGFKRTFHIVKKISEGASSVCYEAYHENSGKGILKEFYPRDAYGLERNANRQLIHSPEFKDAYDRFVKAEQAYVEPYEMLLQAKRDSHDLGTFIPNFEIYRGCDAEGTVIGTTYIWTQEPKLETFDSICADIHKHPGQDPEHKLVTVLTAIESLTKCVRVLHSDGMVHRDIKPSNFGFVYRDDKPLTQTISLFDINSVCSVYSDAEETAVGTPGYMEPEAGSEAASNQTDIYSIGATLFSAVVVTDEVADCLYRPEYYDRLAEMVNASKLIQASEANAHPRLRRALTMILQKSLCSRSGRYENCEELLEDLADALYYALPAEFAKKSRSGEKWILADAQKALDANREKNSFLAIQYHLFAHPLYECVSPESKSINVLVIGFGNYGQKFLDACLQDGQIRGKSLSVTVISNDQIDKEVYLQERPELKKFFQVDGSDLEDNYGSISFETRKLEQNDISALNVTLQDAMVDFCDRMRPHYVFVALGDDQLNAAAAETCKNAANELEMSCSVSYVCESGKPSDKVAGSGYPLYVNADIKASPLYPEIERMAFNTHLVWEKHLNIDYASVKAEFRKPYNHNSCVSNVLSLKYKLHSIGIDLTDNFDEAARAFTEVLKLKKELKNELIWLEHRRWVTEKLCLGWTTLDNLEECAGGITKNERKKQHICLVKSRPNQMLAGESHSTQRKYWDDADAALEKLDELDRMSVRLHRAFVKKANDAKKQDLLSGGSIASIRTLLDTNDHSKAAIIAFQEWFTCLKDLWSGDSSKARLYFGLKEAFLNTLNGLRTETKQSIQGHVKAFEALFYPVLASLEYRDWKQDDVALITSIPFILTYTENSYLAIPFATGDNSAKFENVSAATVASPERILFLYNANNWDDVKALTEAVRPVLNYMQKKRLKAAVEFVITFPTAKFPDLDATAKKIRRIGGKRVRQVKQIALTGSESAAQALEAYLKRRSVGKRLFAVEKNESKLSYLLEGAGFYSHSGSFAWYQFNSSTRMFDSVSRCDMLQYIYKKPFITVADMLTFQSASSKSSNSPEFFRDYNVLWEKYSQDMRRWKEFCSLLKQHVEENDMLALLKQPRGQRNLVSFQYLLPSACMESVRKILQFLEEQCFVNAVDVRGFASDSCSVTFQGVEADRSQYDTLFSNVYALLQADSVYLNKFYHNDIAQTVVSVRYDNLMVKAFEMKKGNSYGSHRDLLSFFQKKGYIINLTTVSESNLSSTVSFTFATRQIKELMTIEGKMLEVYTYHKARESGYFDDVVSGYVVEWDVEGVQNEFDCILTKGFRSLIVECKAQAKIDQEYYHKLFSLTKQFGINADAVLITDVRGVEGDRKKANEMQRSRGNKQGTITVFDKNDINNIGETLQRIMES